jgi:hypothetical protein
MIIKTWRSYWWGAKVLQFTFVDEYLFKQLPSKYFSFHLSTGDYKQSKHQWKKYNFGTNASKTSMNYTYLIEGAGKEKKTMPSFR